MCIYEMMGSSSAKHLQGLRATVALILISSLTFLPSISVSKELSSSGYNSKNLIQEENVLGSRPPGCVNKCRNCRPCRATLVIPPHDSPKVSSRGDDDDSYYLLSWKCRCGNKLYQP